MIDFAILGQASVSAACVAGVGLTGLIYGLGGSAEAQSRPPVSSGASGGANPGNGGSGYNPGNNSGSGYNPGNNGDGGYNPGNNSGSGYNPGDYNRQTVIVFRDSRYRGSSVRFDGEVENLNHSGLNDQISSMRLTGVWMVCTDAYYRGRCRTYRYDVRDLGNSGLNDRISSLRPIR